MATHLRTAENQHKPVCNNTLADEDRVTSEYWRVTCSKCMERIALVSCRQLSHADFVDLVYDIDPELKPPEA